MKEKQALPWTNAKTPYGLLNAVIRITRENPARMMMRVVCYRGESLTRVVSNQYYTQMVEPSCGAVGCVAGWSLILMGRTRDDEGNNPFWQLLEASTLLGLSKAQEKELFLPEDLMGAPDQQSPSHARAVIAHIRDFQKKYEVQLKSITLAETMRRLEGSYEENL